MIDAGLKEKLRKLDLLELEPYLEQIDWVNLSKSDIMEKLEDLESRVQDLE